MRDECEHGSLRRSCEICERDTRIAELEAQVAVLRRALDSIAAWDDVGANDRLTQVGSYSSFDEPYAVETARKALAAIDTLDGRA